MGTFRCIPRITKLFRHFTRLLIVILGTWLILATNNFKNSIGNVTFTRDHFSIKRTKFHLPNAEIQNLEAPFGLKETDVPSFTKSTLWIDHHRKDEHKATVTNTTKSHTAQDHQVRNISKLDRSQNTSIGLGFDPLRQYFSKPGGTTHEYGYLINNNMICAGVNNLTYLIYVHSRPSNFENRRMQRQTWAKNSVVPPYESRVIFMIGWSNNKTIQDALYVESKMHGDIIQEDYIDSYRNLTHKAVGALKWITTLCDKAKFVLKADDDVFADIFRLLRLIREKYWDSQRYFMGLIWPKNSMAIWRPPNCKPWCVNESEMQGKYYPQYLSGAFFIISGDLIKELYLATKRTPFFWVDDVYLTGLLPLNLQNVTYHVLYKYYKYNGSEYAKVQFDLENPKKYLVTLTKKKISFWLKTIETMTEEDKQFLGMKYYSQLTAEATRLFKLENGLPKIS